MPAGLEIVNSFGTILIDENYKNISLIAKGSGVIGAFNELNFSVPFIAGGLRKPVIAIRVTGGQAGLRFANKNFIAGTTSISIVGSVGASVSWWAFDMPVSSGLNYGLQIFNAAGEVVFDGMKKYAVVADYWKATNPADWDGVVKSYSAPGRTLATAFLTQWFYRNGTFSTAGCGGSQRKYAMFYEQQMCELVDANSVRFTRDTWRDDGGVFGECTATDPRRRNYNADIAMLDVTGY